MTHDRQEVGLRPARGLRRVPRDDQLAGRRLQFLLLGFKVPSDLFKIGQALLEGRLHPLELRDVGPHAGRAAIRCPVIDELDPAAVGKQKFPRAASGMAPNQIALDPVVGFDVVQIEQSQSLTGAEYILVAHPGLDQASQSGKHFAELRVRQNKPVVPVIENEALRHRLDGVAETILRVLGFDLRRFPLGDILHDAEKAGQPAFTIETGIGLQSHPTQRPVRPDPPMLVDQPRPVGESQLPGSQIIRHIVGMKEGQEQRDRRGLGRRQAGDLEQLR